MPVVAHSQQVREADGKLVDVMGYRVSTWRSVFTYFGFIFSAGLLRLVFHWVPYYSLICRYRRCSLNDATKVYIKDSYGVGYMHDVVTETADGFKIGIAQRSLCLNSDFLIGSRVINGETDLSTYFIHKHLKYVWNSDSECFELLRCWEEKSFDDIINAEPLTSVEVEKNRVLYGRNEINLSLTPLFMLLLNECLHPFYCFQIVSCILWYVEEYWMYSTCIVVISLFSLSWQVYELRRNERALNATVCATTTVTVCRDEGDIREFKVVSSVDLVPGDLIEIPPNGCLMLCDAILLSGNCIVNESTLTGESVPITKHYLSEIPSKDTLFNIHSFGRNVIYGGTTVIQTRNYSNEKVLAVVARTGFRTAKGELVRSILFPKPMKFKFIQDAIRFVAGLSILALIGFGVSVYLMLRTGVDSLHLVLRALDLITVVVPPALPVATTVGVVFAQRRLKSRGLFCINPNVINASGVIDVSCFDKTGTLTEDGLDLWGVVSSLNGIFSRMENDSCMFDSGPLIECMATCHSLTRIDGVLCGDPLDLKMFQFTKWEFIEEGLEDHCKFEMAVPAIVRPPQNHLTSKATVDTDLESIDIPYEVGILRQFPFSSSLQRMSVAARVLGSNHFNLYTKGAPETIELLCRRDTIPCDFHSVLLEFTRQGFRVLALAWKPTKLSYTKLLRISRDRVEYDLRFLGLLIMENRLKPETTPVIKVLRQANIRPVMVTGDNMLTALSVARDCEMIDELDRIVLVSAKRPAVIGHLPTHIRGDSRSQIECYQDLQTSFQHMIDENGRDLVQFHYAEDLHKQVTEVIATEQNPNHNRCCVDNKRHGLFSKTHIHKFAQRLRNVSGGGAGATTDTGSSYTVPNNQSNQWSTNFNNLPSVVYNYLNGDSAYQRVNNSHQPVIENKKSACSVSIQMLDRPDFHLAMSGKTWAIIREHYPWLIPKLVVKGTVFARFSPEQKTQLIEALQSVGYIVSMCGDGANDCGALKTAHAGISLSEAEASVASPFTYKQQHIGCVPDLIREGRCALVTSFGTFKFMVAYSMIQFFSLILLYTIGSNMPDIQFLYIDLFIITTLGMTFGYSSAYPSLSVEPPAMRLVSTVTLLSLGQQLLTCAVIQIGTFLFTQFQTWYLPLQSIHDDYELVNYESTCIFMVSIYQYIIMAVVFSKGAPYRKSMLSNYLFMINVVVCLCCSLYLTLGPFSVVQTYFDLLKLPSFRFVLLLHGASSMNFLLAYLLESVVDGVSFRKSVKHIRHILFPRHVSRKHYELIREEIDRLVGVWPPLIRSASVHALPRDLFNETETCYENPHPPKRRHISSTSTETDPDDGSLSPQNYPVQTSSKSAKFPTDNYLSTNFSTRTMETKRRARSLRPYRRYSYHAGDFRKEMTRCIIPGKLDTDKLGPYLSQDKVKHLVTDDINCPPGNNARLHFVESDRGINALFDPTATMCCDTKPGRRPSSNNQRERTQSGGARHTYVPIKDSVFTTRC